MIELTRDYMGVKIVYDPHVPQDKVYCYNPKNDITGLMYRMADTYKLKTVEVSNNFGVIVSE